jgi:hypothetical protein
MCAEANQPDTKAGIQAEKERDNFGNISEIYYSIFLTITAKKVLSK